jgi:mannose-6-phosphate isomerase-like protein (cupin superfamily)
VFELTNIFRYDDQGRLAEEWVQTDNRSRLRDLGADDVVSLSRARGKPAHVSEYTHKNLQEVDDMAPQFGFPPEMQARFAREPMGLERTGLTLFRLAPGFRIPFGHRHEDQEEVYVVVKGSARIKIGDDIVELGTLDAVRVPGDTMRNLEAGSDGADVIAFGESASADQSKIVQGWWSAEAGRSGEEPAS